VVHISKVDELTGYGEMCVSFEVDFLYFFSLSIALAARTTIASHPSNNDLEVLTLTARVQTSGGVGFSLFKHEIAISVTLEGNLEATINVPKIISNPADKIIFAIKSVIGRRFSNSLIEQRDQGSEASWIDAQIKKKMIATAEDLKTNYNTEALKEKMMEKARKLMSEWEKLVASERKGSGRGAFYRLRVWLMEQIELRFFYGDSSADTWKEFLSYFQPLFGAIKGQTEEEIWVERDNLKNVTISATDTETVDEVRGRWALARFLGQGSMLPVYGKTILTETGGRKKIATLSLLFLFDSLMPPDGVMHWYETEIDIAMGKYDIKKGFIEATGYDKFEEEYEYPSEFDKWIKTPDDELENRKAANLANFQKLLELLIDPEKMEKEVQNIIFRDGLISEDAVLQRVCTGCTCGVQTSTFAMGVRFSTRKAPLCRLAKWELGFGATWMSVSSVSEEDGVCVLTPSAKETHTTLQMVMSSNILALTHVNSRQYTTSGELGDPSKRFELNFRLMIPVPEDFWQPTPAEITLIAGVLKKYVEIIIGAAKKAVPKLGIFGGGNEEEFAATVENENDNDDEEKRAEDTLKDGLRDIYRSVTSEAQKEEYHKDDDIFKQLGNVTGKALDSSVSKLVLLSRLLLMGKFRFEDLVSIPFVPQVSYSHYVGLNFYIMFGSSKTVAQVSMESYSDKVFTANGIVLNVGKGSFEAVLKHGVSTTLLKKNDFPSILS